MASFPPCMLAACRSTLLRRSRDSTLSSKTRSPEVCATPSSRRQRRVDIADCGFSAFPLAARSPPLLQRGLRWSLVSCCWRRSSARRVRWRRSRPVESWHGLPQNSARPLSSKSRLLWLQTFLTGSAERPALFSAPGGSTVSRWVTASGRGPCPKGRYSLSRAVTTGRAGRRSGRRYARDTVYSGNRRRIPMPISGRSHAP